VEVVTVSVAALGFRGHGHWPGLTWGGKDYPSPDFSWGLVGPMIHWEIAATDQKEGNMSFTSGTLGG
jgi:hypothetical protein